MPDRRATCAGRIGGRHVDYAGDKGIGTKPSDRYAVPMAPIIMPNNIRQASKHSRSATGGKPSVCVQSILGEVAGAGFLGAPAMSDMAPIRPRPMLTALIAEMVDLFVRSGQAADQSGKYGPPPQARQGNPVLQIQGRRQPAGASEQMAEATLFTSWLRTDWENAAMEAETLRANKARKMRF